MATTSEVDSFLNNLHAIMQIGCVWFVSRQKNIDAIVDLELIHPDEDRIKVLKSLVVEDYSEGPIPDDFNVAPMWVFGKEFKGKEIYIKLQIVKLDTICVSFHEAEHHPMSYPLKSK